MPHFTLPILPPTGPHTPKPHPPTTHDLSAPPYAGQLPTDTRTYTSAPASTTAVVIDNGSSTLRAGFSTSPHPHLAFPPLMARYTDRKLNRKLNFVGSEIYFDGTARGQARGVFETGSGNVVNNWDVQEGVLDYVFAKLGVDCRGSGGVDRRVVMTEPLANPGYARKTMSEMLFELYGVPAVAYGVDSLFAYDFNGGTTGLVVGAGNMSTHLIPVVDRKPLLQHATRLDWGRAHCAEFLARLLRSKYPGVLTSGKVTETQIEDLVRQHCYVSQDYDAEVRGMLEWTGLEDRDRVVQLLFQEKEVVVKTAEELRVAEERKKESGRRLQEQAAKMRLDKLIKKEGEVEWLKDVLGKVQIAPTKKAARELLDEEEFKDEAQLERKIKEMDKSIRKQRNKDVGDLDEEPVEPPTYPLLAIPDEELDEEGIRAKRQQRLLKSNHDARARAKAEKEAEKARQLDLQRADDSFRERDFDAWVEERRAQRQALLQRIKERERLKADLGNRKSAASQQRMKNIANLASDNPLNRKRRRGQEKDDDGFGADDGDWAVYREIQAGRNDDEEEDEEEDLPSLLKEAERVLLEFDLAFTESSTAAAQTDWTKSLHHAFLRGPWGFDPESAREGAQLHLNVERVRVPECVFQPSMAGVDQAGIVELVHTLLHDRLGEEVGGQVVRDVFLTGGYCLFEGFEERLARELRAVLPMAAPLNVRRAGDVVGDAWRGAARWAGDVGKSSGGWVTRAEWEECGGEYLREHNLGNAFT
ncbi:Nuclear actin-protein involved in chromatin remodeling [Teratosphaeriaceae sp. CCFEE 6253]|nr:Nuclear actin-protein involved in chromatin remodeling [Teratosphaeriaceae sp. CCFEE 6253]